jgi:uncharacterized protein involved in response to NO
VAGDGRWRAPFWSSGFRPFFLFGLGYGLVAMIAWFGATTGTWRFAPAVPALAPWHGHEMVFGFLAAIICGLLLTALPSWAGVRDIAGRPLAFLVGAWAAGRAAIWLSPLLPPGAVAAVDVSLLLLLATLLAPGLARARERRFLVVLPVLVALAALDFAFHLARATGSSAGMSQALDAAVATIVVLYALVGGFMTPVFTDNALRDQDSPHRAWRHPLLDIAAIVAAVAFAASEVLRAEPMPAAAIALVAAVLHAARLAGWQGWRLRNAPLVLAMHAGYAWLVVAFLLRAGAELGSSDAPRAWVHAVTVGAVGMMIMALVPRVALRHTGRVLAVRPVVAVAGVSMFAAACVRVYAGGNGIATLTAASLWGAAIAIHVAVFGPMFARASLPRGGMPSGERQSAER